MLISVALSVKPDLILLCIATVLMVFLCLRAFWVFRKKFKEHMALDAEFEACREKSLQLFTNWDSMLQQERRISIITGETPEEVSKNYAQEMKRLRSLNNGKGRLNSLWSMEEPETLVCLLYTSDAADESLPV